MSLLCGIATIVHKRSTFARCQENDRITALSFISMITLVIAAPSCVVADAPCNATLPQITTVSNVSQLTPDEMVAALTPIVESIRGKTFKHSESVNAIDDSTYKDEAKRTVVGMRDASEWANLGLFYSAVGIVDTKSDLLSADAEYTAQLYAAHYDPVSDSIHVDSSAPPFFQYIGILGALGAALNAQYGPSVLQPNNRDNFARVALAAATEEAIVNSYLQATDFDALPVATVQSYTFDASVFAVVSDLNANLVSRGYRMLNFSENNGAVCPSNIDNAEKTVDQEREKRLMTPALLLHFGRPYWWRQSSQVISQTDIESLTDILGRQSPSQPSFDWTQAPLVRSGLTCSNSWMFPNVQDCRDSLYPRDAYDALYSGTALAVYRQGSKAVAVVTVSFHPIFGHAGYAESASHDLAAFFAKGFVSIQNGQPTTKKELLLTKTSYTTVLGSVVSNVLIVTGLSSTVSEDDLSEVAKAL